MIPFLGLYSNLISFFFSTPVLLPIPGEAKAKAMPGRLYIHTRHNIIILKNK